MVGQVDDTRRMTAPTSTSTRPRGQTIPTTSASATRTASDATRAELERFVTIDSEVYPTLGSLDGARAAAWVAQAA